LPCALTKADPDSRCWATSLLGEGEEDWVLLVIRKLRFVVTMAVMR